MDTQIMGTKNKRGPYLWPAGDDYWDRFAEEDAEDVACGIPLDDPRSKRDRPAPYRKCPDCGTLVPLYDLCCAGCEVDDEDDDLCDE